MKMICFTQKPLFVGSASIYACRKHNLPIRPITIPFVKKKKATINPDEGEAPEHAAMHSK